jgi:integrase
MARQVDRLHPSAVRTITAVGRHADGGGLYLSISANGGRRWTFMARLGGRRVEIGLGSARTVSLSAARRIAGRYRDAVAEGIDPRTMRVKAGKTFGEWAEAVVKEMEPHWRNPKHKAQWFMTLLGRTPDGEPTKHDYCAALRKLPVAEIAVDDVVATLRPIWRTKRETANRLRSRIERVLDAAKAHGERTGDNPATWKANLKDRREMAGKQERGHHAAMAIDALPAFMATLRGVDNLTAQALEFIVLTAVRTSNVRLATWSEFTLDAVSVAVVDEGNQYVAQGPVWVIPAERMKTGRIFCVPLSPRAVAILRLVESVGCDYVFHGRDASQPMSEMTMLQMVRRLTGQQITVHGFRSTFRDWASERTTFPNAICEAALAHAVKDRTEAAYRRGALYDRRRPLMDAWAEFAGSGRIAVQNPLPPSGL